MLADDGDGLMVIVMVIVMVMVMVMVSGEGAHRQSSPCRREGGETVPIRSR